MKIIIAGIGKVGATLAEQLAAEGYDITLIDNEAGVLRSAVEQNDVMTVNGNCASMDTLKDASVDGADILIAATGSDEVHLLTCVTAHQLNPTLHTIARIRNPEYSEQCYRMRDVFFLSMIFNPEKQTATEIEHLLKYPGFLKRETFAKGRMEIVELKVDSTSKLCNIALNRLDSVIQCRVLICTVLRDGKAMAPDGSFVLKEGDRLFVTASADDLTNLLANLGIVTHRTRRVMLIGGGKISYYLADALTEKGMNVTVIEKDEDCCTELAEDLPKANIILGDASFQNLLESEGIAGMDAVISLTGMDELNILTSLYANSFGVPRIITKLGRVENSRMISALPIGSVISPRKLCCNNVVRYVRAVQKQTGAALTVHSIADGQAEAIEFLVDANTRHCGEALKDIRLKNNILLAGISRVGKTELPGGHSSFEEGDTVIIVSGRDDVIMELNDIFDD